VSLRVTLRPDVYAVVNVKYWASDVTCHVTFGKGRTFLSRNATERWSGRKPLRRLEGS
jgi:hypothetical protein